MPASVHVRQAPELERAEVLSARLIDHRFPLHLHDTFVLQWVTAGSDRCELGDVAAHAGQLLVHGPGEPHDGGTDGAELAYRACYPPPELVAELLGVRVRDVPRVRTLVLDARPVRRAAERLFERLESGADSRTALTELLERVLDGAAARSEARPPAPHPGLVRARAHLLAHLAGDERSSVSTTELARVAGLSRFHLIRAFRRAYGLTPRRLLVTHRVHAARRLIAAGVPPAEAALASGFADQSHLTREFRRVLAFGPGQLRRAAADA